jgi:pyrroloquinoline-quinone synthase
MKTETNLLSLRQLQENHHFWDNKLFRACRSGDLSVEDFKFIFEQYYLYSKNFTRYLAGLMKNLDNDLFRSHLSENLWEEGGGAQPDQRHAEIFRKFLREALEINTAEVRFLDGTQLFVQRYLDFCAYSHAMAGSAFLSMGTEAIVSRMYGILVEGMLKAGIEEKHLQFFRIHMECDDAHAETLEKIMESFSGSPGWYDSCARAVDHALTIRKDFFEGLMDMLEYRRVKNHLDRIQGRKSLLHKSDPTESLRFRPATQGGEALYANKADALNIEFAVDRSPFNSEVLDARVVRIPAGKFNERHRHAHETVFYFVSGSGRVLLDDRWVEAKAGDTVFVPRWALHQTQNLSSEEMVILAVTDFNLTGKVFVGDYEKTARMKRKSSEQDAEASAQLKTAANIL